MSLYSDWFTELYIKYIPKQIEFEPELKFKQRKEVLLACKFVYEVIKSRFNIDKQDAYDIGSGYLTQLSKEMSYARYGEEEAAGMWDDDYHTRETEALDALARGDNEEGFIYYEPDEDLKKMTTKAEA